MTYIIRPMNEQNAHIIVHWRYEGHLALYNPHPDDWLWLLDPENRYATISTRPDTIEGVFCLGLDARVHGGDYSRETALDVGISLRPDLVGSGLGKGFLQAVLHAGRQELNPALFRVTVALFNQRAQRLFQQAGFRPVRTFKGTSPHRAYTFVQMIQET